MTEAERLALLKRLEDRMEETKKFSPQQALDQLLGEGFCVQDGTLIYGRYEPDQR